jgi:fatty-acyl-CoA synthase
LEVLPAVKGDLFVIGDVVILDGDGYMQITDRVKDVIKSGGEWISSIDLENAAAGCPGVAEAAVIAILDPQWGDRPLLIVVPAADSMLLGDEVLAWLRDRVPRWWLPERVEFIDELPHTATGKVSKLELRKRYG